MFDSYLDGAIGAVADSDDVIVTMARAEAHTPVIPERSPEGRRQYRTIWISDVHLGTKGCNAEMLIDFLDSVDSETMYLVGDVIDGWRLKKKLYWPAEHNDIVWRILKRAKRGTRIVYIPGNHDEMFRQFSGMQFGGIEIQRAAFHTTANGRKLMVLHGDEFDAVMLSHRWLAFVGDAAYHLTMKLNHWVNVVRRAFDLPYWSLSKMAKHKVKNAVEFIGKYEEVVAEAAARRGVDGVVCGHIHTAEHRMFGDTEYWNDGDWVEGCNALVEHADGRMRIAIVTDAWHPQVNGVVRTLQATIAHLRADGHDIEVIAPDQFRSVPAPSYPEIRLALAGSRNVGRRLQQFAPDAIHISTEGPLGWAARRWCLRQKQPFTTAYHTQFPDYLARRTGLPAKLFWPVIHRFHRPAERIMVATETIREELRAQGLTQLHHWSRGVDIATFHPDHAPPDAMLGLPRPIQLYVGRVAVEKNIEAFLDNAHPGSKVVVGDGPALAKLRAQYRDAHFLGRQSGDRLAACYAAADVFVFPSRTDTFGLVMIEALACGTPVAAFPVPGPLDVLSEGSGAMAERIEDAIAEALTFSRSECLRAGRAYSWRASAEQFRRGLKRLDMPEQIAPARSVTA